MRLVAEQRTVQHVADRGGALYIWPRGTRCCAGFTYALEVATRPPERPFVRLCEDQGVSVWATPGLVEPDEIHVELDRHGRLRAFWNGQAWIG